MTKTEIMALINKLVYELGHCNDEEFLDRAVGAVMYDDPFTYEEFGYFGKRDY